MFPFRYRTLFRSRWIALLWAAGICWTAVEVAGWNEGDHRPAEGQDNAAAASSSDADLAKLESQARAFEAK